MSEKKLWCWEAVPHGPDWFFVAYVTPESIETLGNFASQTTLQNFAYYAEEKFCQSHQQTCRHHFFVDLSNADAFRDQKNLWIFNSIQIHQDTVEIVCGYGGRGEMHKTAQAAHVKRSKSNTLNGACRTA